MRSSAATSGAVSSVALLSRAAPSDGCTPVPSSCSRRPFVPPKSEASTTTTRIARRRLVAENKFRIQTLRRSFFVRLSSRMRLLTVRSMRSISMRLCESINSSRETVFPAFAASMRYVSDRLSAIMIIR